MKSTYQNKDWDSLSAAAKAEIAKVAIQKGIYSLDGIKSMYNEFAMGGDTSNTVPLGRRYWQAQSNAPTILEKKNTWVKQQKAIKDRKDKALRKWLQTEGVKELNKEVKDYLTTSNDNTWTTSNRNPKNPHLQDRFTKGAKAHASWEKEHPVLSTWGYVLGAVPFAVAAAPLVAAAGSGIAALADAAAATAIGQGVTNFLAPIAGTSIAGASIPQWLDLGLTSAFGAHGIQTAINEGGISPETALEIAPLGRLARPMWDAGKETAYNIADRYIFMPHQNSFTRGIGMTDAGLQDAVTTGVFRGNPRGTEQTAKVFDKMFLKNRNHFRDIVKDTGIPGIESRYQSRTLTKEDFNALKKASKKYESLEGENTVGKITLKQSIDPLENYSTYKDYTKAVASDIAKTEQMPSRIASGETVPNTELSEPMWFEDESGRMLLPQGKPFLERFGPNSDYLADGTPLSYWYADGRNPISKGHAYAKSNYGVRVNNPNDYQPFMHELHLHPSFFRSPKFADPNVEIFGKSPLGVAVKLDKETLQPIWKKDLFNIFKKKKTASQIKEYVDSPKDITSDVGELIAEGSERSVYSSKSNPNIVYKIEDGNAALENINNIKIRSEITDDVIAPETTIGYYKHKNGKYYRVTQQDKYKSFDPDNYDVDLSPELNQKIINTLEKAGWKVKIVNGAAKTASKNGKVLRNLEHYNWGIDSKGNLKLVDQDVIESSKPLSITAENAASITPEQWTAAQDAAIAKGDVAEAHRLRDLHFKVSAPNTKVVDINGNPQLVIHKTPSDFTVFDNSKSIGKLNWAATPEAFGENKVFATGAGTNPKDMRLYINMKNPHYPTIDESMEPAYINEGEDGILGIVDKDWTGLYKSASDAGEGFNMSLGVDNPYGLKSANAVTYDDNGVRIPLGLRDNFKLKDIRYGLLPFGVGLTGYGLLNNQKALGGSIHRNSKL